MNDWEGCQSRVKNCKDNRPENNYNLSVGSLCEEIEKDNYLDVKDGPANIPSTFTGRRCKDNSVSYSYLAYDFDDFPISTAFNEIQQRTGLPCIIHPTYSDTLFGRRRIRAYILAPEILPSTTYESRWHYIARYLDGLGLDMSTGDRTRLNYTARKNVETVIYFDSDDPFGLKYSDGRGWSEFQTVQNYIKSNPIKYPAYSNPNEKITFKNKLFPFEFLLPINENDIPDWCYDGMEYTSKFQAGTPFYFDNRSYDSRSDLEFLIISELIVCRQTFKDVFGIFKNYMPGSFRKHYETSEYEAKRWLYLQYKKALFEGRYRKPSLKLWKKIQAGRRTKNTRENKVLSTLLKYSFQLNSPFFYRKYEHLSNDADMSSRTAKKGVEKLVSDNLINIKKGKPREQGSKGKPTEYNLSHLLGVNV